jgi:hypothetical protein
LPQLPRRDRISNITFGRGVLKEAGEHAKALGMSLGVSLFTDKKLQTSLSQTPIEDDVPLEGRSGIPKARI